jgi:hypothetical protein
VQKWFVLGCVGCVWRSIDGIPALFVADLVERRMYEEVYNRMKYISSRSHRLAMKSRCRCRGRILTCLRASSGEGETAP